MLPDGDDVNLMISSKLMETIGEDGFDNLMQQFLEKVGYQNLKFVDLATFDPQKNYPVYTAGNGKLAVLLWPYIKEGQRYMFIELESERPALDGLHEYGSHEIDSLDS